MRRQGFPWIVLHDVAVLDGHLIMRTPWKPDTTLSRAAQDSSIHEALGGGKRIMVVPRAPGYQKIVELRSLTAQAPLLRITQPGFKERLAQIVSLQTIALPFRPPAAIVNDLAGNLRFNNDSKLYSPGIGDCDGGFLTADDLEHDVLRLHEQRESGGRENQ